MTHKLEINGEEVDVFTADEVTARETAARTAAEGEWKPKAESAMSEKERLEGLLEQRSKEVAGARGEFKRLSDEQVGALTAAQKVIYDNQILLAEKDVKIAESDRKVYEGARDSMIRTKTNGDPKLFDKVKEMYAVINLEDITPEQMKMRVDAAFGAVGVVAPDFLASAGFGGGSFEPPVKGDDKQSYADTAAGKAAAAAFGLRTELTPEQKKALGQ